MKGDWRNEVTFWAFNLREAITIENFWLRVAGNDEHRLAGAVEVEVSDLVTFTRLERTEWL